MTFNYTHADTEVDSSLVYEAYYDQNTRRLAIVLEGGYGYIYKGVPFGVFDGLVLDDSPGGYYNATVKRLYGQAERMGYVGYDNEEVFVKGHPAPDMSNVTGPVRVSGVTTTSTGSSLTFTPQEPVSPYVTLVTPEAPRNTKRTFAVEFVSGGKVRAHTLDADNFGEAESAVLEIGNMLDLDFEVKGISVVE